MSFFKRHPRLDEEEGSDVENVDPNLRLRTTLTAHSTIAESIRSELRQQRRKKSLARARFGFGKKHERPGTSGTVNSAHSATTAAPDADDLQRTETQASEPAAPTSTQPMGDRRMVYVNIPLPANEAGANGDPIVRYVRNKVRTSSKPPHLCLPFDAESSARRIHDHHFHSKEPLRTIPTRREPVLSCPRRPPRFVLLISLRTISNTAHLSLPCIRRGGTTNCHGPAYCYSIHHGR
jgi:phospholipid-translocating ATPase